METKNMSNVNNKRTVLITGCSDGGLGAALATAFHNAGAHVYATARNVSKMAGLAALGIETLELDVLSDTSIAACVTKLPSLDILVNNAGGGHSMPLADISIPDAKKCFDLNVWSCIAVTQAFLPLLIKSKGVVVNQTSIAAHVALPFGSTYQASKAAMTMFSDCSRLELEPFGVRVVDLKTGAVRSNFFVNEQARDNSSLPDGSVYAPAKELVENQMRGGQLMKTAMPANEYARQVVQQLMKPSPPLKVWKGTSASLVRFASPLPSWMTDGLVKKQSDLNEIAPKLRS